MKATARVTLLATAALGRSNPVASGYVALVGIDGLLGSASVHLLTADVARPGETHDVELIFANPDYFGERIRVGQRITLDEGLRSIAKGAILDIS